MKRLFKNSVIVILLTGIAIYLPYCKKGASLPDVTTIPVTNITQTSALVGITLTDDGGDEITAMGVCWSTSPNPTISSNRIEDIAKGIGSFRHVINGLAANTKYYLRAYATNSVGTSYGNEVTFKTNDINKAPTVPTLTTKGVTTISSKSAVSGGTITDDGGGIVISKGICWSASENPTIANSVAYDVNFENSFSLSLSELTPNTIYYVRAFATNSAGTGYGNQVSFKTDLKIHASSLPTVTTAAVSSITSTTAVSGGNITYDGGGDILAKGISWSTIPDWYIYGEDAEYFGNGPGSGSFVSYLSNLKPGTTYYVKAYAVNTMGIAFGLTLSFTAEREVSTSK